MPLVIYKDAVFFVSFSFRERHGFASARGAVVVSREARVCLFRKVKSPCSLFGFFNRFFRLFRPSKPTDMGSSFEDLDARNPTMKTV